MHMAGQLSKVNMLTNQRNQMAEIFPSSTALIGQHGAFAQENIYCAICFLEDSVDRLNEVLQFPKASHHQRLRIRPT